MRISRWQGRTTKGAVGAAAGALALAGVATAVGAGSASADSGERLVAFYFSTPSDALGAKQTRFGNDGTASVT